MVIAITGVTGLLGRNLLFDCLRLYMHRSEDLQLLLFARPGPEGLPRRIEELLREDGLYYLGLGEDRLPSLMSRLHFFPLHLERGDLGLDAEDFAVLRRFHIDHFFHVAADVDFRDTPAVREQLRVMNVDGTRRVVDLCRQLHAGSFSYVSTAYVSGMETGRISPDFLNPANTFKNPYEASKLEAEILVRESFAGDGSTSLKIFRPSTICGRLLENQPGQTNKFDVFYAWTAFFLRMKARLLGSLDYDSPAALDLRIALNGHAGLNIVPVDYAAKAMLALALNGSSGSFHLTAPDETNWFWVADHLLGFLNLTTPPYVDTIPQDLNALEKLYYHKAVGRIYTPYMTSDPVDFDLTNVYASLPPDFTAFPQIDEKNFYSLLAYAKKYNFGLG